MRRLQNNDLLSGATTATPRTPRGAVATTAKALVPEDQESVRAFSRSAFPLLQLDPAPRVLLAIVESLTGHAVDVALLDAIERARLFTGWSGRTLTELERQSCELQEGRPTVALPSPQLGAAAAPRPARTIPNWHASIPGVDPSDLGS